MTMKKMGPVVLLVVLLATAGGAAARTSNASDGFAITACETLCGALIGGATASPHACVVCAWQTGLLNAFYEDPTGPVQRLPLYEAGLRDSAAYPVVDPGRYYSPSADPQSPLTAHIAERTLGLLNGYDADALVTVDSGERLPISTGASPSLCNLDRNGTVGLLGSAYAYPGFRNLTGLPPCADEPGTADWAPRNDIGFASVGDYATALARNGAISCVAESLDLQEGVAERLMDVEDPEAAARELFWSIAAPAATTVTIALFKNASTYDEGTWASVRDCHGGAEDADLDQDGLEALRDAGRLLVYDLSYFETLAGSSAEGGPAGDAYGSQAFFEVEDELEADGRRSVRALAICLSALDDDGERTVHAFSPERSPSAFAIASWHLRASVANYFVFVGHMYELHRRDAVVTYAALNTIDPQTPVGASSHPLRRLVDFFSSPQFNMAFGTSILSSWPPQLRQFYVNEDNLLTVSDDYAAGRFDPYGDGQPNSFWNTGDPLKVATERLGLDPAFWGEDLPQFSVLDVHRRTHALASSLAAGYVDRFWPTDEDVLRDAGLAAFAAYAAAPVAGNMPLTETGQIRTADELRAVLASYIFRLLAHATGRHAPLGAQTLLNIMRSPPGMRPGAGLPEPTTAYTAEEMLAFGPTIEQAWLYAEFSANFIATTVHTPSLEDADDELLEGLAEGWSALLAAPDATGGYLVNPSGDQFVSCSAGRLSPTNMEW